MRKLFFGIILILQTLAISNAHAKSGEIRGILPGEPDPTGRHEPGGIGSPEKRAQACKKGQQRFPILECVDPNAKLKDDPGCMNYAPVLICNDKPLKRSCKKPKVARPVTRCLIRNKHDIGIFLKRLSRSSVENSLAHNSGFFDAPPCH
ncbi:MAG: hypothetical protein HYW49_12405 [Deltaproteobacteria bacterium]|nr:hypothetical protein [Deltaproteobacteria bacterium]